MPDRDCGCRPCAGRPPPCRAARRCPWRRRCPTPTMAGWQARPRLPDSISVSTKKRLMPADAVAREQHAVVAAEQPALVHGGDVDPVRARLERVGDLGRVDADVVVVVARRQRMHAVGPQRNRRRGVRRRPAQRPLQRHEPALDHRLVAQPDVVARQPRIRAHRPPLRARDLPVPQHLVEHEPREPIPLRSRASRTPSPIVRRNIDRRPRHQLPRDILDQLRRRWPAMLSSYEAGARAGRRGGGRAR